MLKIVVPLCAYRYPLMIDPQGQAVSWIRSKESSNLPNFGTAALNDPKLRDKLEFTMSDGKALIILGEQICPLASDCIINGNRTGWRRLLNYPRTGLTSEKVPL